MNSVPTSQLVETTEAGLGLTEPDDRLIEVTVLDATHHAASVKTISKGRRTHFFHLMRFPEGWRVVQSVWTNDGGVIPNQTTDA